MCEAVCESHASIEPFGLLQRSLTQQIVSRKLPA